MIGVKSWEHLMAECFKYLRPGGWVELQEFHLPLQSDDVNIPKDSALARWDYEFSNVRASVCHDRVKQCQWAD